MSVSSDKPIDASLDEEGLVSGEEQQFEDGFTKLTVLGILFVAFVMLPANIYLGLMIGADNPAAEWVTVILFLELARRSFTSLKRQELYVLFYSASVLTRRMGHLALTGGVFMQAIWRQYLRQSPVFKQFGLSSTEVLPQWVAPSVEVLQERSFIHEAWIPAFIVLVIGLVLDRFSWLGMGYIAYRVTATVERLEFPMAPVTAEGATALAESSQKKESWRWPIFSTGAAAGVIFGLFYVAIPTISGEIFPKPVMLLPIPFLDLTEAFEGVLPGAVVAISFNVAIMAAGFILPWRVVVGMFATSVLVWWVANPILVQAGVLTQWEPGYGAIATRLAHTFDLWLSVTIGAAISVALVGFYGLIRATRKADTRRDWSRLWHRDPERGHPPIWVAIILFLVASTTYVVLGDGLVNRGWLGGIEARPGEEFPIWILIAFAFFWTPVTTYLAAHMQGITGRPISLPYVREGSFLISGYEKADIWFAPIPLHNYGGAAKFFRVVELTKTKFTSILKTEAVLQPTLLVAGFLFWWYIWGLGDIPSERYPFVQKMWPMHATMKAAWATALGEGNTMMQEALRPAVILGAAGIGVVIFTIFGLFGLPAAYFYGAITGIGGMPFNAISIFIGMLIGRLFLAKKIGPERWRRYTPVIIAGFSCGIGLVSMLSISFVFLSKAVTPLPY